LKTIDCHICITCQGRKYIQDHPHHPSHLHNGHHANSGGWHPTSGLLGSLQHHQMQMQLQQHQQKVGAAVSHGGSMDNLRPRVLSGGSVQQEKSQQHYHLQKEKHHMGHHHGQHSQHSKGKESQISTISSMGSTTSPDSATTMASSKVSTLPTQQASRLGESAQ
jgi:hypothetical protein